MLSLRSLMSLSLILGVLAACSNQPGGELAADATRAAADAPEQVAVDSSVASACDSIAVVSTDLEPWRVATVDWMREQGHRGAAGERQYGDTIHIRGFNMSIDSADLEASSISWLLALPDFPVERPAEVEVVEFKQILDNSATVVINRTQVGTTQTRLFRPLAVLQLGKSGQAWSVRSLRVWASTSLMSEGEAISLVACSPSDAPSRELLEQARFEGLTMSACAIVGDYSYQPDSSDGVEFADTVDWVALDGRWRARRHATLTVADSNHWTEIAGSDCYCGGVAGFELFLDAVSGEVLEYRPGINCVVC